MKQVIAALAVLAIATLAWAGDTTRVTTTTIGNTDVHRFSDGTRGTTRQIGNTKFHRFSDGTRGTSTTIGDTEIHRFTAPDKRTTETKSDSDWYNIEKSPWNPKNSKWKTDD